jgi:hypothetical protein
VKSFDTLLHVYRRLPVALQNVMVTICGSALHLQ